MQYAEALVTTGKTLLNSVVSSCHVRAANGGERIVMVVPCPRALPVVDVFMLIDGRIGPDFGSYSDNKRSAEQDSAIINSLWAAEGTHDATKCPLAKATRPTSRDIVSIDLAGMQITKPITNRRFHDAMVRRPSA